MLLKREKRELDYIIWMCGCVEGNQRCNYIKKNPMPQKLKKLLIHNRPIFSGPAPNLQ